MKPSKIIGKCNTCDWEFSRPFIVGDKIDFEASMGEVEDMADVHEVNTFDIHSVRVKVKRP